MDSLIKILLMILSIAQFFVFAHFIMSWLISFQVLNVRQQFVAQVWYGLNRLMNPLYSRINRFLPDFGGLNVAPIIVLVAIYALQIILKDMLYAT